MHHQDYNLQFHELKWYEEKKPALMQNQVISKKSEKKQHTHFHLKASFEQNLGDHAWILVHLHFSMCASVKLQTAYSSLLSHFRF